MIIDLSSLVRLLHEMPHDPAEPLLEERRPDPVEPPVQVQERPRVGPGGAGGGRGGGLLEGAPEEIKAINNNLAKT